MNLTLYLVLLIRVTLFQALMLVGIKKASPDVASAMPNLTPGLIFIISACLRYPINKFMRSESMHVSLQYFNRGFCL